MLNFPYCKLEIFLPASHLSALQSYSSVTGCWRPLPEAAPYLGQVNQLCTAPELKVEVTCQSSRLEETLGAIRRVHPYEEPVIHVIPLLAVGTDIPAAEVFQEATD